MGYTLSTKSFNNMSRLHPALLHVVQLAITLTTQDFGVVDQSTRTAEEQNALYKAGKSQKDGYKNKSNHQTASDGYGHAVDLTAYVAGKGFDFNDWNLYYPIALAMGKAAVKLNTRVKWGGNWYEVLNDYVTVSNVTTSNVTTSSDDQTMRDAVERYKKNHPGNDFLDGPHFELVV